MDEARRVIQRLERIEALQSARAPASDLLAEVRHLLREGEAWLAAEHGGAVAPSAPGGRASAASPATAGAEAALRGCRTTLARTGEVMPEEAGNPAL